MIQFYYTDGENQFGPFNIDDLKGKISKDTLIWYEGIEDWTPASKITELEMLFKSVPPPIKKVSPPKIKAPKKNNKLKFFLYTILTLILLSVIIFFGATSISNNNSNASNSSNTSSSKTYQEPPREKTPKELRQELFEKEKSNPSSYLSISYYLDYNIFTGNDIINGTITNSATIATFKDVVLNVTFKTATQTELSNRQYVVYQYFKPNNSNSFKLKVKSPRNTKHIDVRIETAK